MPKDACTSGTESKPPETCIASNCCVDHESVATGFVQPGQTQTDVGSCFECESSDPIKGASSRSVQAPSVVAVVEPAVLGSVRAMPRASSANISTRLRAYSALAPNPRRA